MGIFERVAGGVVMCEPVPPPQFPANREKYREFFDLGASSADSIARSRCAAVTFSKFPAQINREKTRDNRDRKSRNREFPRESSRKRPFLTTLVWLVRGRDLFSPAKLQVRRIEMSNEIGSRVRYGECVWPAHHEAWQQSALNQREYWSMRHTGFRCKL